MPFRAEVSDDHTRFRLVPVRSARVRQFETTVAWIVGMLAVLLTVAGIALAIAPRQSDARPLGMLWTPLGCLLLWLAVHMRLRPPVVTVSATRVSCRDALGFTWRCDRSRIAALDIGGAVLPRRSALTRVPYLRTVDGDRMWLTPLAGDNVNHRTDPAQLAVVDELRALLGVAGRDAPPVMENSKSRTTPRSGRRRWGSWAGHPTASARIYSAVGMAVMVGVLVWGTVSFLSQGVHIDALRGARGARTVTLVVTAVEQDSCGRRTCSYRSSGSFVSPWSGQTVRHVRAIPDFSAPAHGPLRVIVSPAHQHEAVRADYTGAGDIAAGTAVVAAAGLVPLGFALFGLRRLHLRRRARRSLRALAHGDEPSARFRGILRGGSINPLIGISDLELRPDEIVETERLIGRDARFAVALAEVTEVEFDVDAAPGPVVPTTWETTRFRTSGGTFTLTCDRHYVPLLREALARHQVIVTSAATPQASNSVSAKRDST